MPTSFVTTVVTSSLEPKPMTVTIIFKKEGLVTYTTAVVQCGCCTNDHAHKATCKKAVYENSHYTRIGQHISVCLACTHARTHTHGNTCTSSPKKHPESCKVQV